MKTCFEISDLRIDIQEFRTPLDGRTYERKQLVNQVRQMIVPYYNTNYGIDAYLRIKDTRHFKNTHLN